MQKKANKHVGSRRQNAYLEGLQKHFSNFDDAYKNRLFDFALEEQRKEEDGKYKPNNVAKLSYLVLSKKSRKRIKNSYFMEQLNAQKMDGLIDRLTHAGVFDRKFSK